MPLLHDDAYTRQEPQQLTRRTVGIDPYAAWLAEREADRRHDETQVRWVYRYPGSEGRAPGRRILAGKEDAVRQAFSESGR
jgi:hypothetical protein